MQLARGGLAPAHAARADDGRLLSPFARTLLALAVLAGPVLAGVLPEDRADVMYHTNNGGDITVQGPAVLVRNPCPHSKLRPKGS